jgi:hypothetical protein
MLANIGHQDRVIGRNVIEHGQSPRGGQLDVGSGLGGR